MEILFWRHQSSKEKQKGTCTLYCRVTISGQRAELGTTQVRINYVDFDPDSQKILSTDEYHVNNRTTLELIYTKPLRDIHSKLIKQGVEPTAELVAKAFFNRLSMSDEMVDCFWDFHNNYLDEVKEDNSERSPTTLAPIRTAIKRFVIFKQDTKRKSILIHDINEDLYDEYKSYLFKSGFKASFRVKVLKVFLQAYKWGCKKLKIPIELGNCRAGRENKNQPIFLEYEQYKIWSTFEFEKKIYRDTADFFLFCAMTGFHHVDAVQFIKSPNEFLVSRNGELWIEKPRQKTKEISKIPVYYLKDLQRLRDKYDGWEKIPCRDNTTVNSRLKQCVRLINEELPLHLKINPNLSIKHGRCTFADHWINVYGRTMETLLPIMGRRSASGLEVYVRTDQRAIVLQLKKILYRSPVRHFSIYQ